MERVSNECGIKPLTSVEAMNTRKQSRLIEFLGRGLFPGQPPWQQRASVLILLWTMAAGIFTGGGILAFMIIRSRS
jgi:hypothetical protein